MSKPAAERPSESDQDDLDRLWCELWAGYQELLAQERTAPECSSETSE